MNNTEFGKYLLSARDRRRWSQRQLADATALYQSDISQMEQGRKTPSFQQLLNLARALKVSLQWFLSGSNNIVGGELADLSFQLYDLGIVDLHVEHENVPGAFRPDEEAMVLAVWGNEPSARIIEAMPAVLAWNAKNPVALFMHASLYDARVKFRLAWLADIAVTIHKGQGFPGGCPNLNRLEEYIHVVQREAGLPEIEDWLGFSREGDQRPPVSLRWKIGYPAPLASFRARAEHLHALRT